MNRRTKGVPRDKGANSFSGKGPNWVLIAGGALLSTLSIRLGYKLKHLHDTKQPHFSCNDFKGDGRATNAQNMETSDFHRNACSFTRKENSCYNCLSGSGSIVDMKQQCDGSRRTEPEMALPLGRVPASEFIKENGVIRASSPDCLELPQKPFHKSNSSDSPCISEAGSDVFSSREVMQKLRQQLKRRDEMIMEIQDQIVELQNSINAQLAHSSHLQSLLDSANSDLFDSEREIQRLRKAMADCCVRQEGCTEKPPVLPVWPDGINGHAIGYLDVEKYLGSSEKGRDGERIEILKKEVNELKEVIGGKEYLLQGYKEQKAELSMKIKELQQRLDLQLPNIL